MHCEMPSLLGSGRVLYRIGVDIGLSAGGLAWLANMTGPGCPNHAHNMLVHDALVDPNGVPEPVRSRLLARLEKTRAERGK